MSGWERFIAPAPAPAAAPHYQSVWAIHGGPPYPVAAPAASGWGQGRAASATIPFQFSPAAAPLPYPVAAPAASGWGQGRAASATTPFQFSPAAPAPLPYPVAAPAASGWGQGRAASATIPFQFSPAAPAPLPYPVAAPPPYFAVDPTADRVPLRFSRVSASHGLDDGTLFDLTSLGFPVEIVIFTEFGTTMDTAQVESVTEFLNKSPKLDTYDIKKYSGKKYRISDSPNTSDYNTVVFKVFINQCPDLILQSAGASEVTDPYGFIGVYNPLRVKFIINPKFTPPLFYSAGKEDPMDQEATVGLRHMIVSNSVRIRESVVTHSESIRLSHVIPALYNFYRTKGLEAGRVFRLFVVACSAKPLGHEHLTRTRSSRAVQYGINVLGRTPSTRNLVRGGKKRRLKNKKRTRRHTMKLSARVRKNS